MKESAEDRMTRITDLPENRKYYLHILETVGTGEPEAGCFFAKDGNAYMVTGRKRKKRYRAMTVLCLIYGVSDRQCRGDVLRAGKRISAGDGTVCSTGY